MFVIHFCFKEGEIAEMEELYRNKGYKEETAKKIVEILAKDQKVFLDVMMVEGLMMKILMLSKIIYLFFFKRIGNTVRARK